LKEAYFWTHKNSDDFLKYIKREIFEIAYLSASAQMTLFVMIKGHEWTLTKKKLPSYQYWICILLLIERFGTIISRLYYLVKYHQRTRQERKWMNIYRFALKVAVNTTIVILYIYDQEESNKKTGLDDNDSILVQLWFYFNILSIVVEPFYFNIFIPFLHPDTNDKETEDFVTAVSLNEIGESIVKSEAEEEVDAANLELVRE